jgi:hypothetical protein
MYLIIKMFSTEMDVLSRSARKSSLERIKNENIKGNNGGEREVGHHREEKTTMVCQMMPEDRIPKLISEWIPERRKRGRPRKTWMEEVQAAMTAKYI